MKKENKKTAQEARAKARKRAESRKKLWNITKIVGSTVAIVAFLFIIIFDPFATKEEEVVVPEVHLMSNKLLTIADGDDVNFEYTAYVDGAEYETYDSEKGGFTITIGKDNAPFLDDFDDQFIGKHPTDTFKITTTYPTDYTADSNLAGKEVVYDIVVKGIFSYDSLEYSTDSTLTIADGDTVNLDYVGYVDGVAFAGGDTKLGGTDLVIGSNSYIDDFEEQLIGCHPRDNVEVKVTFPDPYQNNPDLAGKEAVFEVYINGVYK